MYAGCITYCPLVSHVEYADETDRQADVRQSVKLCFLLYMASVISKTGARVNEGSPSLLTTHRFIHE